MADLAVLFVSAIGFKPAPRSTVTKARPKRVKVEEVVAVPVVQDAEWLSVVEVGERCDRTKANGKYNGFKQTLRMSAVVSHGQTADTAFSRKLDALGFTRDKRCQWPKAGIPAKAAEFIITTVRSW
jgi:hypothetical protein